MEAEGTLKMRNGQDTMQRKEDRLSTSMYSVSAENFSKVIFPDIQSYYPPKTDIRCNVHISKGFQPNNKDWVGIFKCGWQTTKEYYTWISLSSSEEDHVIFKAYYLPKDDEYYQFCYVDQSGEVRGVSTPFQFREDENDIVIVTTQEEMENINEENERLKATNQELAEKNQSLEAQLRTMEKNDTLGKEIMKKNQDLAEKNQTLEAQLCTATETNNILEKENMDMRIQVKNREEENEMLRRHNLESQMLQIELQDSQTLLKQKTVDMEKKEAENKQLQSENQTKQQALENISGLLDNCKKEVTKQKDKLEVQTSTLETEKRLNEELQRSLEEEKRKVIDLESNLKKTGMTFRKAEDFVSKLQQQLTLQQEENANKVEKVKKLHSYIAQLEANVNKLKNECEEHLRKIENDEKVNDDLQESLSRQGITLSESENKIRTLERDLRFAQESTACIEELLTKEQAESRRNKELITALKATIELREEEVGDLTELYKRKEAEVDALNNQLLRNYATPTFSSHSSTSHTGGLAYRNPYEEIAPRIVPENESLDQPGTRLEEVEEQTSTTLTCPICFIVFPEFKAQVYEDHVMCHTLDN
ncbi:calcium-binding and coiled-coil domain-containing protein 2 [Mantella aurantiaca]